MHLKKFMTQRLKRDAKIVGIFLLFVLVVAVAASLLYFFVFKGNGETTSPTTSPTTKQKDEQKHTTRSDNETTYPTTKQKDEQKHTTRSDNETTYPSTEQTEEQQHNGSVACVEVTGINSTYRDCLTPEDSGTVQTDVTTRDVCKTTCSSNPECKQAFWKVRNCSSTGACYHFIGDQSCTFNNDVNCTSSDGEIVWKCRD